MSHSGAFLRADEYEEFQKPDRCRWRSIVELSLEPTSDSPPKTQDLVSHILGRLQARIKEHRQWFECICIRVKDGDGMTWSAEAAHAAIAKSQSHSHFRRWCLAGRMTPDSMPLIASFIGVRKFLKLAADHELTTAFITLRSWMTPVIIVAAVIIAATIKFLEVLLKAQTQDPSWLAMLFTDYKLYGVGLGLAVFGLILQQLTTFLTTKTQAKSIEKFLQELREKQETRPYADFVERVALQLCRADFPRFVIVDNFESLDYTTAKVIERYFRTHWRNAPGSEFWLILEKEDGGKLSDQVLAGAASDTTIKLFEQALLTREEKLALVRIIGKPETAAEFATVKGICHASGEGQQRLATFYKEYRLRDPKNEKRYGNLEFFSLFPLIYTPGELSLTYRDIVSKFSEKRLLRADVLRQFLKGTALTMEEFRTCLAEVTKGFKSSKVTGEQTPTGGVSPQNA